MTRVLFMTRLDKIIMNYYSKVEFIMINAQADSLDVNVTPLVTLDNSTVVKFNDYTLDEILVVCGEISIRDILTDILNKKSGDSSDEEEKGHL